MSIGPGHTAFVRTPRRIVGRDERIVYTSTSSFEKLYGVWPSAGRFASNHCNGAAQPPARSMSSSALICSLRLRHRLPAVDAVLTIAPPSGMRSSRPSDSVRSAR